MKSRTTVWLWIALAALGPACASWAQCPITFASAVNYPSNSGPFAVAIGDVNGDGRPDVVVGYNAGSVISVYLNTGGGALGPKTDFTVGSGTVYSIALARINPDAALDIVCATNNGLRVLMNNGSGGFGPSASYAGTSPLRQVAVADFNGDGSMDVVAASMVTPLGAVVFINNQTGVFTTIANLPIGQQCSGVGVLDFDNDTIPDLLVSTSGGSNGLYRLKGNGNGTFQASVQVVGGVGGSALTLADLTGDGLPEVLIPSQGGGIINIVLNQGNGVFSAAGSVSEPTMGTAFNVAVADVSGDGVPDLLAPLQGANQLAAHRGLGGTSFEPRVTFPVGGGPNSVAVGDLNGDNLPDAVVTNGGGTTISVLLAQAPAIITGQPAAQFVRCGQTATFTVVASGATAFSWRRNGTPLVNGGHYSGADTATLTVIASTVVEAGSYDCIVTGACAVTSNSAALTINPCCGSDFNGDGNIGTDEDIAAFFRVLGGGAC
jgi:hypothetical protein